MRPETAFAEVGEDAGPLEEPVELLRLRVLAAAGLPRLLLGLFLDEECGLQVGFERAHFAGKLAELAAVFVASLFLVEQLAHLRAQIGLAELKPVESGGHWRSPERTN